LSTILEVDILTVGNLAVVERTQRRYFMLGDVSDEPASRPFSADRSIRSDYDNQMTVLNVG
jgi:hypothetical protein